jgi:ketosteroid isomerase-like protein
MTTTAKSAATGVPADFLDKQTELLAAGDTAGLARRYAEDAVFIRFDTIARGRSEIKKMFDDYLAQKPEILALDAVKIVDDVILYQAGEKLSGRTFTAVGTLVFRDGLVWRQTATFVDRIPA